jgi:predicted ABC-type sugar transport system permease subunit
VDVFIKKKQLKHFNCDTVFPDKNYNVSTFGGEKLVGRPWYVIINCFVISSYIVLLIWVLETSFVDVDVVIKEAGVKTLQLQQSFSW